MADRLNPEFHILKFLIFNFLPLQPHTRIL